MLRQVFTATAVGIVILPSLGACVSLKVDEDKTLAERIDEGPRENIASYQLSQTIISASATVTLNDCDSVIAKKLLPKGANLPKDAPPIDISETFTVVTASQADGIHRYSIDLKKIKNWTKQINLSIARNPNQTLVSVNGTITDQAGPIILAAAQTAIAIGGAVAVPAVAPVVAAKTIQPFLPANATVSQRAAVGVLARQGLLLSQSNLLADFGLKEEDKPAWVAAFAAAQAVEEKKGAVRKGRPAPHPEVALNEETHYCRDDVRTVLRDIAEQQLIINNAVKSKSDTNQPSSDITRAQARINFLIGQNNLTRTFVSNWIPTRAELAAAIKKDQTNYPNKNWKTDSRFFVVEREVHPLRTIIGPAWLSDAGLKAALDDRTTDVTLVRLRKPLVLRLQIRPWTVGRAYGETALPNGSDALATPSGYPDGVVYREPALAILRTCLGTCGGVLADSADDAPKTIQLGKVTPEPNPWDDVDNSAIETTADVAPQVTIPIDQLGQLRVQAVTNVLFETSSLTLAQNADGSISGVGSQTASAAAAGFAAATTAANSQASAVAARNTAIGAVNTATAASKADADTLNKNLADCLTQQQTILKAGVRPTVACQ